MGGAGLVHTRFVRVRPALPVLAAEGAACALWRAWPLRPGGGRDPRLPPGGVGYLVVRLAAGEGGAWGRP